MIVLSIGTTNMLSYIFRLFIFFGGWTVFHQSWHNLQLAPTVTLHILRHLLVCIKLHCHCLINGVIQ